MKITFWGVRGSVCAPGSLTCEYGGNTSCIELRSSKGELFILDAGTGIRKMGLKIFEDENLLNINLLLTHAHWDHIEGLPFFKPLYFKRYHTFVFGFSDGKRRTKDILSHAFLHPYFPVSLSDLKADLTFKDITGESAEMGNMRIDILPVNHTSQTVAFRFNEGDKKVIYMTDNELFCPTATVTPYEKMVAYCRDADVLIHDAMYTQDEWNRMKGWGHSSIPNAVQLGMDAKVKVLFLFHHDPERTDKQLDTIIKDIRSQIKKSKSDMVCEGAREGLTVEV